MFSIHSSMPKVDIEANNIKELEKALSFLNPLCLSFANYILKKEHKLIACGIGEKIYCIPYQEKKREVEICIVYAKEALNKSKIYD